ncbi:MAG: hypothetical protein CMP66_06805 [Flavobacteriales bacterium]|nr:hypothetical protein [Flavobacteriales bacterium]|tara:strand:+ start:7942 stop:8334 length:393 start_codon:yes stop_codon:yes gene_type:complete
MKKINSLITPFFLLGIILIFSSCEKDVAENIVSDDAIQQRSAYIEKGYTEVEVAPIIKESCFFEEWDKNILTPVSGLFEYYDSDDNLVASIDFGDGTCDEWATKTWDVDVFPEHPHGSIEFSVFDYKKKK